MGKIRKSANQGKRSVVVVRTYTKSEERLTDLAYTLEIRGVHQIELGTYDPIIGLF